MSVLTGFTGAQAGAVVRMVTGLGVEGRMEAQVSPEFSDTRGVGQLFQRVQWNRWAVSVEVAQERSKTASGGFSVRTRTANVSAWGLYRVWGADSWSSFVDLGGGPAIDSVESQLGADVARRRGVRWRFGGGLGLNYLIWDRLLLEGEARMTGIQDRKEPAFSLLLRAGVSL